MMIRFSVLMLAVVVSIGSFASGEEPGKSRTGADEKKLTAEAEKAAEELKAKLPEGSEARAMLDNILSGSRLGAGEGWFRLAVSQTRFDWPFVEKEYDADGDHRVARKEFRGSPEDFSRLDRDQDQFLTEADLDWSASSVARTPGYLMFFQADADANGKVTPEEFQALFRALDGDSRGFLSLDDVRDKFQPPTEEQSQKQRAERPDHPDRSTLVIALSKQEVGSLQPGPQLNESAPDFTLRTLKGDEVTLSKEVGPLPIVLIFGNFTCGPFRSQSGNLEKLHERYRDRAKFFLVYVREAHPSDGWWMTSNERAGIKLPQPKTTADRRDVARSCQNHLKLSLPFLVDTIDDAVGATYSGMPNRLYLVDQNGKIAFKNGRGPFGFHPRQLEQALILLLNHVPAK